MSRVGREPIKIPDGVEVKIDGPTIAVKGKLGELGWSVPEGISARVEDGFLKLSRSDDSRSQKALHGLSRALAFNMVKGVKEGYSKDLEIVGVGYRCDQNGRAMMLSLGFSHKVIFIPPEGVEVKVNNPTTFTVKGIDKELVGDVAAKIRSIKPPEPYKGKGIKYAGEYIRRKAGKTAGK